MLLIIYLSSLLYRTLVELLVVELLAGTKFLYKSIIRVCIEFVLDPECKSNDLRRITSSNRKPVVATLIQYPRSTKIGLPATGNLFIAFQLFNFHGSRQEHKSIH